MDSQKLWLSGQNLHKAKPSTSCMEDGEPAQDEAFSIQHGWEGVEGGAPVFPTSSQGAIDN